MIAGRVETNQINELGPENDNIIKPSETNQINKNQTFSIHQEKKRKAPEIFNYNENQPKKSLLEEKEPSAEAFANKLVEEILENENFNSILDKLIQEPQES